MRIRYKPWARKELEESNFYREHPEDIKGNWKNEYARQFVGATINGPMNIASK